MEQIYNNNWNNENNFLKWRRGRMEQWVVPEKMILLRKGNSFNTIF